MINKLWDFWEDLEEAAGGPIGIIMGFVLPLVGIGLSVWVLIR